MLARTRDLPWGGLSTLVAAFFLVYAEILISLSRDWSTDDNYSHGFLVIPAAAYLAWLRRNTLRSLPVKGSTLGALIVGASLALLLAGTAGIELFVTRVSMVGVIAGSIVFLFGWAHLRVLALPVGFLVLMIPLPAILFNQIAFPLQLLATRFGVSGLELASIPVLREGNVIVLANTTLEVAEACSGIRSLISLFTLAVLYGQFAEDRLLNRIAIVASAVPIAIVANGLRVAGTGAAAHFYGAETATGFFHSFSGWIVFGASFALILLTHRVLQFLVPAQSEPPAPASPQMQVSH